MGIVRPSTFNLQPSTLATRRSALKGLAGILAAGIAPSLCAASTGGYRGGFLKGVLASGIAPSITMGAIANAGSANASVRGMMRGIGARQAAMFGREVPVEVSALRCYDLAYSALKYTAGQNTTAEVCVIKRSKQTEYKSRSFFGQELSNNVYSFFCSDYSYESMTGLQMRFYSFFNINNIKPTVDSQYKMNLASTTGSCKINDTELSGVGSFGNMTGNTVNDFGIMCNYRSSIYAFINQYGTYDFKYLKIMESGNLAVDIVAAKLGSVPCFYDRISGNSYFNLGSGNMEIIE